MKTRKLTALAVLLFAGALVAAPTPVPIEAQVSPQTIVEGSDTVWLTVHTDIALSAVDTKTVAVNGIPVAFTKSDNHGNLVAKFAFDDVLGIVSPPSATLTLTGTTKAGGAFAGSDTVRVIGGGPR